MSTSEFQEFKDLEMQRSSCIIHRDHYNHRSPCKREVGGRRGREQALLLAHRMEPENVGRLENLKDKEISCSLETPKRTQPCRPILDLGPLELQDICVLF